MTYLYTKLKKDFVPDNIFIGTNEWIKGFGFSSDRVVAGKYEGQGIIGIGGVKITLPMFNMVSLDSSTVKSYSIISHHPTSVIHFVRQGKYQVEIVYFDNEKSIIQLSWKLCEKLIKSIPISAETVESLSTIPIDDISADIEEETIAISNPARAKDRDLMDIIRLMEKRFEEQYKFAYKHLLNLQDCQKMYAQTVKEFECLELPLMAQVRFEQLCAEYKEKFNITNPFVVIDAMDGYSFEQWCAELLRKSGFTNVEVTQGSGDQGVDVIAVKDGVRYAIQCKCYSSDLGNKPVQEVHTGKSIYHCQVGVVMTNRYFTSGGKEAADATGVLLWDRNKLKEMIEKAKHTQSAL